MAAEPILDLSVFNDRNFAVGTLCIALIGLGFNSSMLLLALYTQKILAYDAWNSGLVLAPGGLGTMIALMISGRLVARMDQRLMLGRGLPAERLRHPAHDRSSRSAWTTGASPGRASSRVSRWASSSRRCRRSRSPPSGWSASGNATAAYNVVRNVGGSIGVALATTLLVRRSQEHQSHARRHVERVGSGHRGRLKEWTEHFVTPGRRRVHRRAPRHRDALSHDRPSRRRSWPTSTTSG